MASIAILITVLASFAAMNRIFSRTDRSGQSLSAYVGYYGWAGGSPIVQIVSVDGWDMFGLLGRGNTVEMCGVLRPIDGGLSLDSSTTGFLSSPGHPSKVNVRLTPDKSKIILNLSGLVNAELPRRSLRPNLQQLWDLDGKSSTLSPCAPTFPQHVELLWKTMTGFE